MKFIYDNIIELFVGTIFLSIMVVGILSPDEKLEKEPWIPRETIKEKVVKKTIVAPHQKLDSYDDADKSSSQWDEFLEEIDNLGYHISDPEAIEIWETQY
jgi:hypothetical protein